jgi:phosphoribosylanthranilate isomerase
VLVQLYGVTTVDDARCCVDAGADHVGLVVREGHDTWDEIELEAALRILADLEHRVRRVVCTLATELDWAHATARATRPDLLHLARATHFDPSELTELRAATGLPLMCTVPVVGPESVDLARSYAPVADYLLLDSIHPTSGVVGATGLTHDWSLSAQIVREVQTPVILAGGLGPDNVAAAVRQVRPAGVDSETNTSRPDERRRKDPDRVQRFVRRARATEEMPRRDA